MSWSKPFSVILSPRSYGLVVVSIFAASLSQPAAAVVTSAIQQVSPGNGRVKVQWGGTNNVLYQVECAASLSGPWQYVEAPTTAFAISNVLSGPAAFYRVSNYTNTTTYQAN